MKLLHSGAYIVTLFGIMAFGQTGQTYSGRLNPQLAVDYVHVYERLLSVSSDLSRLKFLPAPEKGSVISVGELSDSRAENGKSTIVLVEPQGKAPFLWFDSNSNNLFEAAEQVPFRGPPEQPEALVGVLQLPIKHPFYSTFPIFVQYLRGFKHPNLPADKRLLLQSVSALAFGSVEIGGRSVLFQYPFDPKQKEISTTDGVFGVDVDGDGRITNEQFSPETAFAMKDELVFPLVDRFVSTASIDSASGKIIVRERNKADYARVDLKVGMEMPDFDFTDFEGKKRRLSDFRGKFVMVDFWGVWCIDCTRETPFHIAAYEQFRKRGFEILGLDSDENIEIAREYIKKNNITWPQATHESIKKSAEVTYRIQEYPSTILLGPDGKVLILDQNRLRGNELLKTLERILPKK